jgi:hypothetical protein
LCKWFYTPLIMEWWQQRRLYFFISVFSIAILGIEPMPFGILGKHCTTSATPITLYFALFYWDKVSLSLPVLALKYWFYSFYHSSRYDYRHVLNSDTVFLKDIFDLRLVESSDMKPTGSSVLIRVDVVGCHRKLVYFSLASDFPYAYHPFLFPWLKFKKIQ